MENQCFCCNKQTECPSLYYILNPITYINPKIYKNNIPKKVERICADCVVEFFLQRNNMNECPKCKAYYYNDDHPCIESKIIKDDKCVLCANKWDDEKNYTADGDYIPKIECIGENLVFIVFVGLFKIISEKIIVSQGIICNTCLKKYTYEPYLNVVCNNCRKQFSSIMCESDTAHGCSATVYDSMIKCNYGSKYDGDSIIFMGKHNENIDITRSIKITDNPVTIYIMKLSNLTTYILDDKPKHLKYGSNICDVCIDTIIGEENCCKIVNVFKENITTNNFDIDNEMFQ